MKSLSKIPSKNLPAINVIVIFYSLLSSPPVSVQELTLLHVNGSQRKDSPNLLFAHVKNFDHNSAMLKSIPSYSE